jgi:hypothetical protein
MNAGERVLRRLVKNADERIGLHKRQRPQEHGVDNAEDGGVGPNAEPQHGDHSHRERRRAEEHAQRVSQVGEKRTNHGVSSGTRLDHRIAADRRRIVGDIASGA